jgi:hypothetical protein
MRLISLLRVSVTSVKDHKNLVRQLVTYFVETGFWGFVTFYAALQEVDSFFKKIVYFVNIVACRPVARQQLRVNQLYNSHCQVTAP